MLWTIEWKERELVNTVNAADAVSAAEQWAKIHDAMNDFELVNHDVKECIISVAGGGEVHVFRIKSRSELVYTAKEVKDDGG